MNLDPLALGIAVLSIGGIAALVAGVLSVRDRGDALMRRLADSDPNVLVIPDELSVEAARQSRLGRWLAGIARLAGPAKRDDAARLELRLQQAGIRSLHAASAFLGVKVILAVSLLFGFLWINAQRVQRIEPAFLVAVIAFAAGFYLPDLWLAARTRSRQTAIERALPDALDLLVTCVEAGLGLDASLQRVAGELRLAWKELSDELTTTFLEVRAGIPRIEAFRRLASRTGVRELKSLAATLTQTEIFGTSVATALRIQGEGIRVRRMQRAEEKAAYIAVKMTLPLVLCILPSLLAVIIGPAILRVATNLLPALGGGR